MSGYATGQPVAQCASCVSVRNIYKGILLAPGSVHRTCIPPFGSSPFPRPPNHAIASTSSDLQISSMDSYTIRFHNNAGSTGFTVVVFLKNTATPSPKAVAWQTINTQGSSQFDYLALTQVSASYTSGGQKVTTAQKAAPKSSSWVVKKDENGTYILVAGKPHFSTVDPSFHCLYSCNYTYFAVNQY